MIHFDGSPVHPNGRPKPPDNPIEEADADLLRRLGHLARLSEHALTWAEAVLENQLQLPVRARHHDLICWLARELRKHGTAV
jgi:hypothetical protein